MTNSASVVPPTDRWDAEIDLLVVGAGAAGMTTALVAALEGLKVLVCEKSSQVGGTTATAAGTIWVPGSSQSRRAGLADSPEAVRRYLDGELAELASDPVADRRRRAFLETGPEALDYLEARSAVVFVAPAKHPDYHARSGAALAGRALIPPPFDGRTLGADFALVRPPLPEFMVLGGMIVGKDDIPPLLAPFASLRALRHALGLLLRHAGDRLRHARGTRLVMGNALVGRLLFSLRAQGVPIWLDSPVRALVQDGGRVLGAVVASPYGGRRVRARIGVVLAGGGFAASAAWRARLLPQPTAAYTPAFDGAAGEGLALAEALGAALDDDPARGGLWTPVSVLRRADGSEAVYPHILLDRAKPGLIAINRAGRRFVNEADSYHDFVLGMYRAHAGVPTIPAHLVCDRRFIRRYGIGLIHPGTRRLRRFIDAGYLIAADTLADLARRLGVDPAALADTVAHHNRCAETGIDDAFGKGASELNRFNGDPLHQPNPCLGPIAEPPFFAVAVWPGVLATSAGLKTDEHGVVQDRAGAAIPGLYACGNDMASVMRGAYPGPGTTLGPALVFGYRVALHAAGKPVQAGRNAPTASSD
ncbi:MAG TPA: FAD-dependent oxidoreductase [Candidatus Sulfotelmatobacter sp.]|nr:FAD-dependent oxidoreductase [Candidatus Sulfotelmatobacter sp.]